MIQIDPTLTASMFITCLLTAIFLTLFFSKKDSLIFLIALLLVGAMALLSLSQTLELIMI
jgi:hypothetical protein